MLLILKLCSLGLRTVKRIFCFFEDWFGLDPRQLGIISVGLLFTVLGCGCWFIANHTINPPTRIQDDRTSQMLATDTNNPTTVIADNPQKRHELLITETFATSVWNLGSIILPSIGCSIVAAGIIYRISQARTKFQNSLETAAVLLVGDREAFEEVIGWDKWIDETRLGSELIFIGKDQELWADKSAAALSRALQKGIPVRFVFQGKQKSGQPSPTSGTASEPSAEDRLTKFWEKLLCTDHSQIFKNALGKPSGLTLQIVYDDHANYSYYWNGEKLVVKVYFGIKNKRTAPLIVFNTSFACGKFHIREFSPGSGLHYMPQPEKKQMLIQAAVNIDDIITRAQESKEHKSEGIRRLDRRIAKRAKLVGQSPALLLDRRTNERVSFFVWRTTPKPSCKTYHRSPAWHR